ncbi:21304_t:CDS:2 [Cetraspora pellucida]|uniref:21304_t:CDS:1 n=1 Tax=Cetraspora pellucida TaxID=1433469 RepID=A0A9N9N688_9GLOM|nr:21304_t:CDS:2 [Cetraspora pellucida]
MNLFMLNLPLQSFSSLQTSGLELVEDDKLEKEDKMVNENELDVQKVDKKFAEALQEYKKGEDGINNNVIVKESNKT